MSRGKIGIMPNADKCGQMLAIIGFATIILAGEIAEGEKIVTTRQRKFAENMLRTPPMSATQAAISAGYAPKSAGKHADRLAKSGEVAALLAAGRAQTAKSVAITRESLAERLRRIADGEDSDDTMRMSDRLHAMDSLAKLCGLNAEQQAGSPAVFALVVNTGGGSPAK